MTQADVKQLLQTIVEPLVTAPEQVKVTIDQDEFYLKLNLFVAPEDIGRVIGKHGRVASAIRTIIYSVRLDEPKEIRLNIVDD
ncbi:KH domain-containing protein [Ligilactobacillus saerimneri]|uniref:RNA-binding protein KhpA n=2 Tax=Ligilactobacillus saerimneri TaxID=228229 RepID=M5J6E3_9LACO|nr:KH domain-containing protein [Ligilactobacillus saerimneri]EKW98657.1 RNA binding protein [Ligilactobacillus saerimneri 30a]KRL74958.1 hypothetical protein FC54_GL000110 [Ligilactobacillus saerimneri DSM 16049]MBU5308990.1 KH domain-containing protein [Ligilactobacillus saerimneri]MCZ0891620.1 KH domain-containing protein [Ligilactobacillus saerimneri]MDI9205634.1 KH domain-containing protein [Ligilactobacillus saerimneri]